MKQFAILSMFYLAYHRFKVTIVRTRFGEIECFAYDAASVTDEQVRQGQTAVVFAQGTLEAVMAAIKQRDDKAW